ncbi:hypothetical protein [Thermophilibacter sp.]
MDAIFSTTELRDHPREVKAAARAGLVRITENGKGAYVFCSEDVFRQEIDDAVERSLYVARVEDAIQCGRAAIDGGDCVVGLSAARESVAQRRAARG